MLHWGKEGEFYPFSWQVQLARKLVDNGAAIIVGHHPHVIQGYEVYNGALIAYSLGNFISDSIYQDLRIGFYLECVVNGTKIDEYNFIPV